MDNGADEFYVTYGDYTNAIAFSDVYINVLNADGSSFAHHLRENNRKLRETLILRKAVIDKYGC